MRLLADNASAPLLRDLVSAYQPTSTLIGWDIRVAEPPTVLDWLSKGDAPYALVTYRPGMEDPAQYWATPVGQRGVAVVVHPTNPIPNLSAPQLRGILQGRITNWQQVGGRSQPITVVARDARSTDAELVQNIVLGDVRTTYTARLAATGRAVIDLVGADASAIGYVSVGYLSSAVRAVPLDGVLPNPATLTAEQYPIRAPILFVGQREPQGDRQSEAYRAFFAWVQSPAGQAVVQRQYGGLGD